MVSNFLKKREEERRKKGRNKRKKLGNRLLIVKNQEIWELERWLCGKWLAGQACGLSLDPQHPCEKLVSVPACNPNHWETGLAGQQSSRPVNPRLSEKPCLRKYGGAGGVCLSLIPALRRQRSKWISVSLRLACCT